MKIGINSLYLIPGEVGGSERYLRELLQAMVALDAGHEFVVFTNNENDPVFRAEYSQHRNVSTVRIPCNASNRYSRVLREQFQAPAYVKRAGVDVLWSAGQVAVLRAGCPQALTIFDMQYKHYPEDFSAIARWTTDFLLHRSIAVCDRVLTISSFSRDEILKFTRARPEQVSSVLLAADQRYGVSASSGSSDTPYILTVANSYPHKNLHRLVEGYARICDSIPHDLVIVGKARRGEYQVEEVVRALQEPARVKRVSGLSDDALVGMYQGADVFCFPSLYEGFGLPVLESIHARVPVVVSDAGSLPEIGGEHVVCVDPLSPESIGSGLKQVLGWSEGERHERIEAAAEWAEAFTWERAARETLALLQDLVKETR